MSDKVQRIFIIFIAMIFLASAAAVVVYPFLDKKKPSDLTAEQQKAIADAQNNKPKEAKLKGTKLENFEPIAAISELKTIILKEGSAGAEVKPSDTVTVNYTGALALSGIIFESSIDSGQAATFPLSGVIKGWTDGLPGMKIGETRRLLIPYAQAYGEAGSGDSIPPKADLVFDVTLVKIGQ